jgi:putative ATP-dependent endonuclease of the OLD family
MKVHRLELGGRACFNGSLVPMRTDPRITIVIGRNNVGKSQFVKLLMDACAKENGLDAPEVYLVGTVEQADIDQIGQRPFAKIEGFAIPTATPLVGECLRWRERHANLGITDSDGQELSDEFSDETRYHLDRWMNPLYGRKFIHLKSDRDIGPEISNGDDNFKIAADGRGTTDFVRTLLLSDSTVSWAYRAHAALLSALNEVFHGDTEFEEVLVKVKSKYADPNMESKWEIFLKEVGKEPFALSNSGSGLKTVILVLLNLIIIAKGDEYDRCVFVFEELENNLHPALLRRLLKFIDNHLQKEAVDRRLILTTHSSVILDAFALKSDTQIIHIAKEHGISKATLVDSDLPLLSILKGLGTRPSDILQANGVIWVEGPSDAIYISRWIELISGGRYREGRDYVCAFYGGSTLARIQVTDSKHAVRDMLNVFPLNRNLIFVFDSDRASHDAVLKHRVQRIVDEVEKISDAATWVSKGREIENYLTGKVIAKALKKDTPFRDPEPYENFYKKKGAQTSYIESVIGRSSIDKVDLAMKCCEAMTLVDLKVLDLEEKLQLITKTIVLWNEDEDAV